jgi:hypothetical protein
MPATRTPARIEASRRNGARPRGPYERRWVMELVTAMWRQDRLQALELRALAAATVERPPGEATMKRLLTLARHGARIDKDIGRALQALRVLRDRPDAYPDEPRDGTPEPGVAGPPEPNRTNGLPPRTSEPDVREPHAANCTNGTAPRTSEPAPRLNRHQRRALAALQRRQPA